MDLAEFIKELEAVNEKLDHLQEELLAQNSNEVMWELGEAIGSINNALDELTK